MIRYFIRIATLISQIINTIFLFGTPDMTVSARCYINRHRPIWGIAYRVINKIFFFQVNHCKESFEEDIKFAEDVLKLKDKR